MPSENKGCRQQIFLIVLLLKQAVPKVNSPREITRKAYILKD